MNKSMKFVHSFTIVSDILARMVLSVQGILYFWGTPFLPLAAIIFITWSASYPIRLIVAKGEANDSNKEAKQ